MKNGGMYVALGLIGLFALCAAVAAGFFQSRTPARADRVAIGAPISDRQLLERRRANVGVVAVGGATTQ